MGFKTVRNKLKYVLLGGVFGLSLCDPALLTLEKKDVVTGGYQQEDVAVETDIPFDENTLERLVAGEDIIPGLPEQGAMCAKAIRALVNTLLGEPYFKHHRLFSKAGYRLLGEKHLEADALGVYGDAWEMFHSIQEKGGKLLYFGENPLEHPEEGFEFAKQHAQIGDILGFYYRDSPYNSVAREAGAGFTHLGLVVGFNEETSTNGSRRRELIIAHLFHSDLYFPEQQQSKGEQLRKEALAAAYGVELSTIPALRVETLSSLINLRFNGYHKTLPHSKLRTEPAYQQGDHLILVKAILRPDYSRVQ